MRASDFEFRNRFWIFGGIYWLGFGLYAFDHSGWVNGVAHWANRQFGWNETAAARGVLWSGFILVLLAAMLRTWATAYLQAEVMSDPNLRTERLVADGPYRRVRNPLYLGGILMSFGFATMASLAGALVIVIGNILFPLRLIAREEAELFAARGENYRRFLASVPSLVPSIVPKLPASGARPAWRQALLGESFFYAFAAAMLVFALTLQMQWFGVTIVAGMALYGLSRLFAPKKQGAAA